MAFDGSGNLYVANAYNASIGKITPTGNSAGVVNSKRRKNPCKHRGFCVLAERRGIDSPVFPNSLADHDLSVNALGTLVLETSSCPQLLTGIRGHEGSEPGQNRAKSEPDCVLAAISVVWGQDPFLATNSPGARRRRRARAKKKINVIYCRYSSDLQRTDSIHDQERRCREGLDRMGIAHDDFIVLADEAMSGISAHRQAFQRLKDLIDSGEIGIVVVSEQSRLSRNDDAKSLIKNIVFAGGRFISVSEGIDTTRRGWKTIVGISEIHHARSSEDTAERVRGAQEGRVRDGNGSAGDYPFGYVSEYTDPAAAAGYRGRGPKPKREVVIEETAAAVVRDVFRKFAIEGESISSIVRWWEAHKEEFPRITKSRLHHEHVRRLLMNKKFIGAWTFGETTTVYDGDGNKKQVPARPDQIVTVVDRPTLRIIDQEIWDKAQARLAQLKTIYGMKPEGKKRGPAEHYRLLYQKSLIGGLVTCGSCGARLIVHRGGVKSLACPNHKVGRCAMSASVRCGDTEQAVLRLIADMLESSPVWMEAVINATRDRLEQLARAMPNELAQAQAQEQETSAKLERLVDNLQNGLDGATIRGRITNLESQKLAWATKVAELSRVPSAQLKMPDNEWIRGQLKSMAILLTPEMSSVAASLRPLIATIVAEQVLMPGKKRGFVRLHVTFEGWALLLQVLGNKLPQSVLEQLRPIDGGRGEEIVVDLGGPTMMDRWGPQILAWRQQKVKWVEICRRTGLKLANAYIAYKRCRENGQSH